MKKFFAKILGFLGMLFTSLDTWIHDHVQPSIETVQKIKELINSPLVDVLTAIIPGDADDKLKDWIRANIGKALNVLNITADITNQPTIELQLQKLLEYLKTLSPSMQKGVLMRLASEMAISSGGRENVKGHAVDLLVQLQYSKLKAGIQTDSIPDAQPPAVAQQPAATDQPDNQDDDQGADTPVNFHDQVFGQVQGTKK